MIGPVVILVVASAVGAVQGGVAGLVGGLLIGLGIVAAVVAGMAAWAQQIGGRLAPEEALASAPRPWGFGLLSDRVYRRLDPGGRENA